MTDPLNSARPALTRRAAIALTLGAAVTAALAGCAKKSPPAPPPGVPDTYPRSYPSE